MGSEMCIRDRWAVARGWALAFGVMNDWELPDAIPPEYAHKYGVSNLRDDLSTFPEVTGELVDFTWEAAHLTVEQLKQHLSNVLA